MKVITICIAGVFCMQTAFSQGFYSMKRAVDSVYVNDNSEDGPKAKVGRMANRWGGQFGLSGSFTQAAQNFNSFATGINPNTRISQSGSCAAITPVWREIGPTMDNSNSAGFENTGAGQMNRMTFHPNYNGTSNQTIYALSRYGGIWVTHDDGENWKHLDTDPYIPFSSLGVLVIDPVNPSRMYVTTGDPCGDESFLGYYATNEYPLYTLGIYGSDDGGQSWQKINTGIGTALLNNPGTIYNMKMDPGNRNNLIFTSTDGVYTCTNASGSLNSISWTKDANFASAFGTDKKIIGLTCNPSSYQWYVSGTDIYTTADPFVPHSWQLATGPSTGLDFSGGLYLGKKMYRVNVFNSPITGITNDIFAVFITEGPPFIWIVYLAQKTGSGSWQILKSAQLTPNRDLLIDKLSFAASPVLGDYYLGSGSMMFATPSLGFISAQYGNMPGLTGQNHADIHALHIHPSVPQKLWVLSDGGIQVKNIAVNPYINTRDYVYKNNGIQSHLQWDLDDSETDKDFYISALQDNGIVYRGGLLGNTWGSHANIAAPVLGDGYDSNIYDANPAESFVTGNRSEIHKFNYLTGAAVQTTDKVVTGHGTLNYYADPQYPTDRIYVGSYNLEKSLDNGVSFQGIGPFLTYRGGTLHYNNTPANTPCGNRIFRTTHPLNYRSGVPFNVYALSHRIIQNTGDTKCSYTSPYSRPSLIAKSTTGYGRPVAGGDEFTDVENITNALYDAALASGVITPASVPYLSDIACHPYDGNKVWVCSSDLIPGLKVWRTTNGGTTWTNADPTGVLSKMPVFCVVAAPGPNDLVFAGTMDGVYYTDNTMNGVWCRYGASPSVQVFSLKINPCKNVLLVGTYGRGAFEVSLPFVPNLVNIDVSGGTVTWNTPKSYPFSSVHVKSGTTLIIDNTTVGFGPNSRLYVEKGARLIVRNNAELSSASACNGYMWLGIELQGDQGQRQQISSGLDANHGFCVIETGGTIKNALVGVKNFASLNGDGESIDWARLGGGILQCNGAKFINCSIGVRFIPYGNKNALNQPSNDLSFISASQFLTDASTAALHFEPEAHVSMWYTRGIRLSSNVFKNNTPSAYAIKRRGMGIVSYDASYDVIAPCASYGANGCNSYGTPNTFENLYYGIDAGAALPTASARVLGNSFVNNHRGMVLHGVDYAIANRNTFSIGSDYSENFQPGTALAVSAPCGVFLDGCDAYNIRENTFTNASGTGNALDFGIVDSYSNTNPNELRMNYFNNIAVGIQAQDNNDRLQLKCNEFSAGTMGTADVKVMGQQSPGSIDPQQGSCPTTPDPTKLPGNKFSHSCAVAQDLAANTYVGAQITYNTRTTPNQELPQSGCYNTSGYVVNICSGSGSGDICPIGGSLPGGGGANRAQLREALANSKAEVSTFQKLLLRGNRSQLYSTIASGNQARLIDSFALAGPYLSDSVLLAFLRYRPLYGNTFIKTILVGCSPLSAAVMAEFALTPVSGSTRDAVNVAQSGTSQRTQAQRQLSYAQKMLVVNYNNLIANIVNDREEDARLDTLSAYLDYSLKPASRAAKVGALLEQGRAADAMSQAGLLTGNAELKALLQNLVAVYSATNAVGSYTGTVQEGTDNLRARVPYNIGVKAQALHHALFKGPFGEVIYLGPAQQASASRLAQEAVPMPPKTDNSIRVFPNPARNEVYVVIEHEAAANAHIALYDLQGRLLLEKQVENHQEFHTLDLNSLADGIYMYQVSAAGRSLKTGKLVVIK